MHYIKNAKLKSKKMSIRKRIKVATPVSSSNSAKAYSIFNTKEENRLKRVVKVKIFKQHKLVSFCF